MQYHISYRISLPARVLRIVFPTHNTSRASLIFFSEDVGAEATKPGP
jgi:hypothetical protein